MRYVAMCSFLMTGLTCSPHETGSVIGPAGGTVSGPDGAKVVIPAGALTADLAIGIEQTSDGAPPLPGGLATSGPMYAFTPHGTSFAVPVTLTMPFDAASVPAGSTPALYKTDAQDEWGPVAGATFGADTVTARITSFSFGQVVSPLERNDPVREWVFSWIPGNGQPFVPLPGGSDMLVGGQLEEVVTFGPMNFDSPIVGSLETLPSDGLANGAVFSTPSGATYGVMAEAPDARLGGTDPIGSNSRLTQTQSFKKHAADAFLRFTVTRVTIEARDFNPPLQTGPAPMKGEVLLAVQAYKMPGEDPFFYTAGRASVFGANGAFFRSAKDESFSRSHLWGEEDFDFSVDDVFFELPGSDQSCPGTKGLLLLRKPRTYTADISSIGLEKEFTMQIDTFAMTYNRRGGGAIGDCEASSVHAFLRDPLEFGGTTLEFEGLEPTNRPLPPPAGQVLVAPAACVPGPGPDPAAGTLQFDAPSYTIDEFAGAAPTITVTRTGGSRGAVTATFSTSDDTAIAGTDYMPVHATVFFADGDSGSRVVEVPIVQDLIGIEPDETVNLTLSEPGGCAALGAQRTAVLTIRDDDSAPPTSGFLDPSFGTGGKVMTEFGGDQTAMALQADGKIVMVGGLTDRFALARYNGDGGLDMTFGSGGKVTTDIVTDRFSEEAARCVAIQADGKIVVVGYGTIADRPVGSRFGFVLARYDATGALDMTFGTAGTFTNIVIGQAFAVAIQPDGKIVVVGTVPVGPSNLENDFVVARFRDDGSLDPSFHGGLTTTDFALGIDVARNVVLQPDGAILVSGEIQTVDQTAVARYDAAGNLDMTFGDGGKVVLTGVRVGEGLALQTDGKIVLAGSVDTGTFPAVTSQFALVRLQSNGSPDDAFGTASVVKTAVSDLGDEALAVAVQSDGKIVAAGRSSTQTNSNFALARYTTDGALDTTLAGTGKLTIDFGLTDLAESVAVQADGKIVLGGMARANVDGYGLARVSPERSQSSSAAAASKRSRAATIGRSASPQAR
jgi:uncharacterized delta-60 repeat protein